MRLNKRTILVTVITLLLSLLGVANAAAESQTQAGVSWTAQYWNNIQLSGEPVVTRTEAAINHEWGQGSPYPAVEANRFSARWTTSVVLEEGNYRFTAVSDDGVRVWVDGIRIIDNWSIHPETEDMAAISLAVGSHNIAVEYFENTGLATMQFGWEQIDDPEEEQVNITPTSGPAGTTITVFADGFTPQTNVIVGIGPANSETVTDHTVMTNVSGDLETQINVPDGAQPGDAWVVLVRSLNTVERATSEEFIVTGDSGLDCGATYTVMPGDWLSLIARRCNIPVEAILALNPQIVDPNVIAPGQVLELPGAEATTLYNLNFRPDPTVASEPMDVIPAGTTVPVITWDESDSWILVVYDGRQGWIAVWLTNIEYIVPPGSAEQS